MSKNDARDRVSGSLGEGLFLRYAAREELYDLAIFLDDCWKLSYKGILDQNYLDNLSAHERYQKLLIRYDSKKSDFLLLWDGDKISGVVVYGESTAEMYPDDGEISALYLRADLLGHGYGHALILTAEEALRAKGYTDFVLDVFSENTSAVRFYQDHGYTKAAENIFVLGERLPSFNIMRKGGKAS